MRNLAQQSKIIIYKISYIKNLNFLLPTRWRVSQWSSCSACKGNNGAKTRKVQCVRPASHLGGEDVQIELDECTGTAPKQVSSCVGTRSCEDPCAKSKTKNSQKREENPEESILEDTEKINNLINMGLAQYLDSAEDENFSDDEQLMKLVHELLAKDKRMCPNIQNPIKPPPEGVTEALGIGTTISSTNNVTESVQELNSTISAQVNKESVANVGSNSTQLTESLPENVTNVVELVKSIQDTDKKSLSTLAPDSIIRDYEPADQVVLLEAPLKDDSFKANLSDLAFQELGDTVPIKLDIKKQKIYRGPAARILINEMEYGNISTTNHPYDNDSSTGVTVT